MYQSYLVRFVTVRLFSEVNETEVYRYIYDDDNNNNDSSLQVVVVVTRGSSIYYSSNMDAICYAYSWFFVFDCICAVLRGSVLYINQLRIVSC